MKIPSCALKAYVLFCMHVILLSKVYIKIVQNMTVSKHSVHFTVFVYLFLAVLGLGSARGLSLVAASRGLLSSCGAWASHCGAFPY